jgi:hypothetical protein
MMKGLALATTALILLLSIQHHEREQDPAGERNQDCKDNRVDPRVVEEVPTIRVRGKKRPSSTQVLVASSGEPVTGS